MIFYDASGNEYDDREWAIGLHYIGKNKKQVGFYVIKDLIKSKSEINGKKKYARIIIRRVFPKML